MQRRIRDDGEDVKGVIVFAFWFRARRLANQGRVGAGLGDRAYSLVPAAFG